GMGISFAMDIQPYFEAGQANCVRCHSGGSGPAGVNLDSYAEILAGGNGFSLVVPGDSTNPSAALIPQLNASHHDGPNDAGFVVILSQWIDEGALNN
ncbi:MAG: c-type cytochrome domain-containing protein, partial [Polyangiales bacterium]